MAPSSTHYAGSSARRHRAHPNCAELRAVLFHQVHDLDIEARGKLGAAHRGPPDPARIGAGGDGSAGGDDDRRSAAQSPETSTRRRCRRCCRGPAPASIDSDPAPVVASSRNAKQNMIGQFATIAPSSALRPEAGGRAPAQRRPVLVEVREGHLAGRDESRDPREQSDDDQQAEDEFDQAGPPERPGADRQLASPSGQPNNFDRAVQREQQTEDDPEDAQDGRGVTRRDGYPVGRHGPDPTRAFGPGALKSPGPNGQPLITRRSTARSRTDAAGSAPAGSRSPA